MPRNIQYQFLSAINDNFKEGQDKHSLKADGMMNGARIFSYAHRKDLRDTSADFSKWMKDNYPDIKMVKYIKTEHIQGFINERADTCSMATLEQYVSRFNKLENVVNATFGINVNYRGVVIPATKENTKIRNIAMSQEDFKKLVDELKDSRSSAKEGIQLGARIGLRVSEAIKLQGKDINLEKGTVHVHNGKGAKSRDIIMREEDRAYFADLKARKPGRERICKVQPDTLNKEIRRYMKRVGIDEKYKDTTEHAIRKMYAQAEFDRYRAQGDGIKRALGKVSVQLGHSDNRSGLMREYVLDIK